MYYFINEKMNIKFNNVKTLMKYPIPNPNDIELKECILFVYTKCYDVKYHYVKNDNVYLIQIDKPYHQWEFEDTFSLGSDCEGFIPGMIRAFKSNSDNGIVENY